MKLDPIRLQKQQDAVRKWIASGCRGVFSWGTGTGKTIAAILAIKSFLTNNKGKNILVVVPTEHLQLQWSFELQKFNIFEYVNIQVINSAIKQPEEVDLLVLDELHRYFSDTFSQVFSVKQPKLVLGLSATFNRLDGRHKPFEQYLPIVDTITIKEALANDWLSDYREYKVLIKADDLDIYRDHSKAFSEMFAMFDYDFNFAMKCLTNIRARRTYAKQLGMTSQEMDAIVFTWKNALHKRKDFINNHPSKIEVARRILNARPYNKAITFSGSIKQAEKIGIGKTIHSGKTKKKNRITLEEFNNESLGVINTSKALDEGVDVKGLSLAVIMNSSSSKTTKIQRRGRVIRREEGKVAEIFTLVMEDTVEERWFENSSEGSNYIEITEDELELVLNYKKLDIEEQEGKEIDQMFRV